MNGIENIIARIEEDAEQEINKILADARGKAEEISAKYASLAAKETEAILEKGKKSADDRTVRLQGVAGLDARKMLLRTKQEMIDAAFRTAEEKLTSLEGEDYVETLAKLGVAAVQTGNEEVILSAEDREKYGKDVVSRINELLNDDEGISRIITAAGKLLRGEGVKLSDETREISGGLILKDGDLEIDASFATIVNQMRESLAGDVAEILFG
ncbi:MAG: hypothetical protein IKU84_02190 [Clostridia bacterium]|nr:hypothetical protein [Clostridia bacterium]